MEISKLTIKGFKSFGNKEQTINLNTNKGELILVAGHNGAGKCIRYNTIIGDVIINNISKLDGYNRYITDNAFGKIVNDALKKRETYTAYNITIGELYELSKVVNINLSKIVINTPNGYKKIKAVALTAIHSDIIRIDTDRHHIECSPNHKILSDDKFIIAKELKIGDIVKTINGDENIVSINLLPFKDDLYDIEVCEHEYYANGIISHNSTLLSAVEYVLYGKVRGKDKKWTTLSTLPNRINGTMVNSISFNSNGTDIEIIRGESPKILELYENGILYDKAGKSNINDKIENYVDMDIETFKSFISMSINDFKNFISLSNEEKQLLLDKLFNLEVINQLNDILKEFNKNNKIRLTSLTSEINTLTNSISSIHDSIQKFIEKEKENKKEKEKIDIEKEKEKIDDHIKSIEDEKNGIIKKIKEMTADGKVKYGLYTELKKKIDDLTIKEDNITKELDDDRNEYSTIKNEINNTSKEIELYNKGKCPTCGTDFHSEHFISLKSTLEEKIEKLKEVKTTIEDKGRKTKKQKDDIDVLLKNANKDYNDLSYIIKDYKNKIGDLKNNIKKLNSDIDKDNENKKRLDEKKEEIIITDDKIDVDEFEKSIKELEMKKDVCDNNISTCKDNEIIYKELNKVFGENGVKKSIISNIIKPINKFIDENMEIMGMPFNITIDDTFTAKITQYGNVIDYDTLSTGETKKINIAIVLAYLKLIRTKKHINILFLDEVFSSIDVDGIDSILTLLKSFANEYKINIFVVHHAILNQDMFDRILRLDKDVFTNIIEIK